MNRCYFIAEAGINHNGNIETAKRLASAALESGADAVKFQTSWGITRLENYVFSDIEWYDLKDYCDDIGITFLSTPHTFSAIHFLDELVPMYKVASTYLGLPNFLVEVAKKEKPILLSVGNIIHDNGMATDEEIWNALNYIPDADITLLHCVSKYPCEDQHYERIDELRKFGYPVGLSDHSLSIDIPRDISVLEKHFMLDYQDCIDSCVSLNPKEFSMMVDKFK